ncbi:hypothetical protein GFY24_13860 [Nocardia sp. SYP-A9097]|uniref:hypothetical protein n=1 Tax=Nocardia sp. SYP-A9097 TaxID=2663237 RepID=UPI00129A87C8|nr:hypothetical protein [Nocardia sp. SYP-A9097]MRH88518.1 hypothetical protein [Nocardia sp. SYP-A9097]
MSSGGDAADGQLTGVLHIQFDDPARNFCGLDALGGATGQELADRWWPDVPL